MLKKMMILTVLVTGFAVAGASDANAWIVRRIAPVRRVAARAVLPPYPVARRAVVRPVLYRRPVVYGAVRPMVYGAVQPVIYASPVIYIGY